MGNKVSSYKRKPTSIVKEPDHEICASSVNSSGTTTSSSSFKHEKVCCHDGPQNIYKTIPPRTSPVPENPSVAMQVILDWIKAKNHQNVIQMYCYAHEDAHFYFPDTNMDLPMRKFWNGMMAVFQAMPDFTFSYSKIEEPTEGTIVLTNYGGAGYHNGFFQIANNPSIPPTGAYLTSDPVIMTIHVDPEQHKITKLVAKTMVEGGLAGPMGLYMKAKQASQQKQE